MSNVAPGRTIAIGDVIDSGQDTNLVIEHLLALSRQCNLTCIQG